MRGHGIAERLFQLLRLVGRKVPGDIPGEAVDLRRFDRSHTRYKRGRPRHERPWSAITGITLHQTANAHLHAHHRLTPAIPAHALVDRTPRIALLHPPTAYMAHGHRLNRDTIGIEIVANAAGIEGDPTTLWRTKRQRESGARFEDIVAEATDAQCALAVELIGYYCQLAVENGGRLTTIWAHRQSAGKPADPGQRIWRNVARKACVRFDLEQRPLETRRPTQRSGEPRPLPDAWTGLAHGVSY